jgi:hypothetical protein
VKRAATNYAETSSNNSNEHAPQRGRILSLLLELSGSGVVARVSFGFCSLVVSPPAAHDTTGPLGHLFEAPKGGDQPYKKEVGGSFQGEVDVRCGRLGKGG